MRTPRRGLCRAIYTVTVTHPPSLHLLLHPPRLLHRIIHLRPNPLLQLLIPHPFNTLFAIHARLLRRADNAHSYNDADVADAADFGVEPALGGFVGGERVGEGGGGGVDHGLGYCGCLGEDGAEADAGENVHVVA